MEHLIYRKAESASELESLLQLRYTTFVEGGLSGFLTESEDHIDIDAFDLRAVHFGLFREADGKPVGYIRRVQDSVSQQAIMVQSLACRHVGHAKAIESGSSEVFPMLTYLPDRNVVRDRYRLASSMKRSVVEAGRLSLERTSRCISAVKFFIAATIAAAVADDVVEAVITLAWSHRAFYERFGFRQMAGTENHVESWVTISCMHWMRENLPLSIEDDIMVMADNYGATGRIESWATAAGRRRMVA